MSAASGPGVSQYVDQLESPGLKAYFDVGNILFYGFPHDWIRTLGARIVKVHLNDFTSTARTGGLPGKRGRRRHRLGRVRRNYLGGLAGNVELLLG